MNKADLIEYVAEALGESKASASRLVDAVFEGIVEGIRTDERVTIAGFGTFRRKNQKARNGVNPATKEIIRIGPSKTVKYTPSQILRNRL